MCSIQGVLTEILCQRLEAFGCLEKMPIHFFFSLARASESSRRIEMVVPIGVDEHI